MNTVFWIQVEYHYIRTVFTSKVYGSMDWDKPGLG